MKIEHLNGLDVQTPVKGLRPWGTTSDLFTDMRGIGLLFRKLEYVTTDLLQKDLAFFSDEGDFLLLTKANLAQWDDVPYISATSSINNHSLIGDFPWSSDPSKPGGYVKTATSTVSGWMQKTAALNAYSPIRAVETDTSRSRIDFVGYTKPTAVIKLSHVMEWIVQADVGLVANRVASESPNAYRTLQGYIGTRVGLGTLEQAFHAIYRDLYKSADNDVKPYVNKAYIALQKAGAHNRSARAMITTMIEGTTNTFTIRSGLATPLSLLRGGAYYYHSSGFYPTNSRLNVLCPMHAFIPPGFPSAAAADTAARHLMGLADETTGRLRRLSSVVAPLESWNFVTQLSNPYVSTLEPQSWKTEFEQTGNVANCGINAAYEASDDNVTGFSADSLFVGDLIGATSQLTRDFYQEVESQIKSDASLVGGIL